MLDNLKLWYKKNEQKDIKTDQELNWVKVKAGLDT